MKLHLLYLNKAFSGRARLLAVDAQCSTQYDPNSTTTAVQIQKLSTSFQQTAHQDSRRKVCPDCDRGQQIPKTTCQE